MARYVNSRNSFKILEYADYQGKGPEFDIKPNDINKVTINDKNSYPGVETMDLSLSTPEYYVGQIGEISQDQVHDVIDFDRISISADRAANGIYTSVNTQYWGDQDNLTYKILNDDGVVVISLAESGTILGYTTLETLNLDKNTKLSNQEDRSDLLHEKGRNAASRAQEKSDAKNSQAAGSTAGITAGAVGVTGEQTASVKNSGDGAKQNGSYNPHDNLVVNSKASETETVVNGEVTERRSVPYTDAEIRYMAQIVENEAGNSGTAGQVAIAEEIRNRTLSDDPYYKDTVKGVLDQGYKPWIQGTLSEPSQETMDMCREVLDGNLWVFGRDDVLSHASHSGTGISQTQPGVSGSSSYASFYYDDINRTQTFYTSGELTEQSKKV